MATTIKMGTIPGVYIQEEVNPALGISEARLKIAGIIGHSSPTLDVTDLQVLRGSGNTDTLPYTEHAVNSIYSVSDYIGAKGTTLPQYIEGVDFTLEGNVITWLTHPGENEVVLADAAAAWIGSGAPAVGDQVIYVADASTYPGEGKIQEANVTNFKSLSGAVTLGGYVYHVDDFETYPASSQVKRASVTGDLPEAKIGDYVKLDNEDHYVVTTAEDPEAFQVVDDIVEGATGAGYVLGSATLEGSLQVVDNILVTTGSGYVKGYTGAEGLITVIETASRKPEEGNFYYISCNINKEPGAYQVNKYADLTSVVADYGPEYYTEDGEDKVNELVVGAKLMFLNGASVVYVCQVEEGNDKSALDNIKTAIDKFEEVDLQGIVCVASAGSMDADKQLQTYIQQHVNKQSNIMSQHERIAIVKGIAHQDDVNELLQYAASFRDGDGVGDQRIIVVAPCTVSVDCVSKDGEVKEFALPSTFAGAAMFGRTTDNGLTVAEPLTRKTLAGIKSISTKYTRQQIEKLSAGGVLVLIDKSGLIKVNQSVTTDISNQNNRELSVVLIKDEVRKDLRALLDTYIGHFYNRKKTPTTIKSAICGYLDSKLDTLIEGYDKSDVIVLPDETEATQVNVNLKFAVLRPLNYIYLSFMVVL